MISFGVIRFLISLVIIISSGLTVGFLVSEGNFRALSAKNLPPQGVFFKFLLFFGMVNGIHTENRARTGRKTKDCCARVWPDQRGREGPSSVGDVWRPAVVNSSTINAGENTSLHK